MRQITMEALQAARSLARRFGARSDNFGISFVNVQLTGQPASDVIRARLLAPGPAMIARFGSAEFRAALCVRYADLAEPGWRKAWRYVRGEYPEFWWERRLVRGLVRNAGFFPDDPASLRRFGELLIADMHEVDVLGSWLTAERVFARELQQAVRVNLEDLPPYVHREPWSEALAERTVLVVHPFARSIEAQYRRRELLFEDARVLPAFELRTLQAVQSIAYNDCGFPDWFAALEHMKSQIERIAFDVAIIGCGAYGFALAAHVKRLGRKAVHLGGATQLLFGIRGQRWDGEGIGNEHWVRPLSEERPPGFEKIEGGCYW